MNRSFLIQGHATVKRARCAKETKSTRFAVVTLVRLINVCLGQDKDVRSKRIPLDDRTICFEKCLLTQW